MTIAQINLLSDKQVVEAILARDEEVTKVFLYEKCYPLFKAAFDKYTTDCIDCVELINAIYVYIMVKGKKSHMSKLEGFGFNCTLTNWLKIITENYCHQLYKKKSRMVENRDAGDSLASNADSLDIDLQRLDISDLEKVLSMMSNERYRMIIRYRYAEGRTNEEIAQLLGMNMSNFYNKHRLAKAQFRDILKKERLI